MIKTSKGVSEIIVVTLVIVVTVILAGVLFSWFKDSSKRSLDQTSDQFLQASDISCTKANYGVDSCKIYRSSKTVEIMFTNSSDLKIFNLMLTVEGKSLTGNDMRLIGRFEDIVSEGQVINLSTDTNFTYTKEDYSHTLLDPDEITSVILTNGTCPKEPIDLDCEIVLDPLASSIVSPVDSSVYFSGATIDFNAASSGGDEGYTCSWDSNVYGSLGSGCNISNNDLNLGTHLITLSSTDNFETKTTTATITVKDHVVPSISSPADESTYTEGDSINFIGSATNNYGAYTCTWDSNIDETIGNNCDINVDNLTIGTHTITLNVTDTLETKNTTITIIVNAAIFRKSILFDHTKVDGDLTNFPVLISLTDANLQALAKADGTDIYFTASDGVTKLKREIEDYNSTTGTLTAWVKVPALSSTVDTQIYMYFGNANINDPNDTDVWDSNFAMIQHFNANLLESTINSNNGINYGATLVTGKFGTAYDFNGTSNYINAGNSASLNPGLSDFTVSLWVKFVYKGGNVGVLTKGFTPAYGVFYTPTIANKIAIYIQNGGLHNGIDMSSYYDQWTYVTWRVDNVNNIQRSYLNGVFNNQTTNAVGNIVSDYNLNFGRYSSTQSGYFDGTIDEARISNTLRSEQWIKTEYNNQNSPSTFYSVGIIPSITNPANGSTTFFGTSINFVGSADNNYGAYTCSWDSNLYGTIGTGCNINKTDLNVGTHLITLSVTDEIETKTTNITIIKLASGVILHLDANAIVGLTDGNLLGTWYDLSGNNNDATQITDAKRPTYKTNILNGKPIVRFSTSTPNWLIHPTIDTVNAFTYFLIYSRPAIVNSQIFGFSGSNYPYLQYGNNWYIDNQGFSVPLPINTFEVLTGQMSPGANNAKRWRNSVSAGNTTGYNAGDPYKFKYIGIDGWAGPQGDIAEIIIYNKVLSDQEREQVEQYLGKKWLGWE